MVKPPLKIVENTKTGLRPSIGHAIPHVQWSGYWTYMAAMTLVFFVFYVASNGLLQQWINLLVWSVPENVVAPGGKATLQPDTSATTPGTQTSGTTTPTTAAPSFYQSFLSALGFGTITGAGVSTGGTGGGGKTP